MNRTGLLLGYLVDGPIKRIFILKLGKFNDEKRLGITRINKSNAFNSCALKEKFL